jgi:lantibiotic transport system permease protein
LGLYCKNFLVPLGVGLGLYVASMIATQWRYGYTIPYTYSTLEWLGNRSPLSTSRFHIWAAGYSVAFLVLGYILYITKKEKG